MKSTGMRHIEGSWPDNVDGSVNEQVDRYIKKATKDNRFKSAVAALAATAEAAVRQNNSVDIYEQYFVDCANRSSAAGKPAAGASGGGAASAASGSNSSAAEAGKKGDASASAAPAAGAAGVSSSPAEVRDSDAAALAASFSAPILSAEAPYLRGVAALHDPAPVKRTATSINWHPEGTKLAVAYSVLKFQDDRVVTGLMPTQSYVWDIASPNAPVVELLPPSPLTSLRFNSKTPDILAGGCYNGLVALFDVKKPRGLAVASSALEKSHHDPVYDVFWVQSKTNNQFCSCSTGA